MVTHIMKDGTVRQSIEGVMVSVTPLTQVTYNILQQIFESNVHKDISDNKKINKGGI